MTLHASPAVPSTHSVDPVRWPDVAAVPRSSWMRTAVTQRLLRRALGELPLRVRLPSGEQWGRGGPLMELHDPTAFHRRVGRFGLIGFGESYMAGEWDTPDPVGLLSVFAEHADRLLPPALQRLRHLWAPRKPAAERNTVAGSRAHISHHYDLSNELFALFLDETLSYSAGLFRSLPADQEALAPAQRRKVDHMLDLADVGPGTRLLEIGTGWGELALRAARRGAEVVSVTLSQEQLDVARHRVEEAGLSDRVSVRLHDYRQVRGSFDAVVSVEMIEAVGAEHWPVYLGALDRLLVPGGRAALQAITMSHQRMLATRNTWTWIHKYIFPGGLIPSREALTRIAHEETALCLARYDRRGPHYAETLRLWRERFAEHTAEVSALGFDAVFRRMWDLYLAYSEAGFRTGYLDVQQLLFIKDGATAP